MAKNKVDELAGYFGHMNKPKSDGKPWPGFRIPRPVRPSNIKVVPPEAKIAVSPYQKAMNKKLV